jgi:hypothetical protein
MQYIGGSPVSDFVEINYHPKRSARIQGGASGGRTLL